MSSLKRRGLLLILSSPSGAGKSTLTRNLVREDRQDPARAALVKIAKEALPDDPEIQALGEVK